MLGSVDRWMYGVALLFGGCGSLVGEERLEDLMEVPPIPESPVWEVRWYLGDGKGLAIDCEFVPESFDGLDELMSGGPLVDLPTIQHEPVWLEGDDFRWGLALFVLVDRDRRRQPTEPMDDEPLDMSLGVWGVMSGYVLLFADGDPERIGDALAVSPGEFELPEESPVWMGLIEQVAEPNGDFRGAMWLLDEEESALIVEDGVSLTAANLATWRTHNLFSGAAVGGVRPRSGCVE